ncbi:hypothetical protein [Hydrocarboniclastica marina]|nr:hypothetical protein [Hydrocarboniclastica marina]
MLSRVTTSLAATGRMASHYTCRVDDFAPVSIRVYGELKFMDIRFRSPAALFALAVIVLFSLFNRPVSAQETDPILEAVHNFRLQNYLAINAFYNYSSSRDPETLEEIVLAVNQANGFMQTIADARGEVLPEKGYQTLAAHFQDFKKLMNTNVTDVRNRGYADLRLVSELAEKAGELNQLGEELYDLAAERADLDLSPPAETAREASILLAQMMSQYSIFTSSTVAQVFQGGSDATPLDQKANDLNKLMEQLSALDAGPEASAALEEAYSAWQFIKDSYIKYNERNVSFVINRYSKKIIASLEAAIPTLGRKSTTQAPSD